MPRGDYTDIYQTIMKHNQWTAREAEIFAAVIITVSICALIAHRVNPQFTKLRTASTVLLVSFMYVVVASTLLTRNPGKRIIKYIPFWSWYDVITKGNMRLLKQITLNCILLFPMGLLLPLAAGKRISPWRGFLLGFAFSALIETSQLVFRLGWFEWDDMLHNGLGCMMGCVAMDEILKLIGKSNA